MKHIKNIRDLLKKLEAEDVSRELVKEILITVEREISEMADEYEAKIEMITHKQLALEKAVLKVSNMVDEIEQDIYEDNDAQNVVCPYCNYEFEVFLDEVQLDEINCPECNNIIELSWDHDDCDGCGHDGCDNCH